MTKRQSDVSTHPSLHPDMPIVSGVRKRVLRRTYADDCVASQSPIDIQLHSIQNNEQT